ncbi:alanine racemase [Zhihengliuella halotolerans]|uniref:alanine racemase n=1 Tax=Zhihengliuella halotolerans TaxID=370736 RepID=UPI0015E121C9|nr:alanine racemase [Zhihengliuella halotolerans]
MNEPSDDVVLGVPDDETPARWERRAEIDLSAIRHNVRRVAELAAPAKVMAVVKADAYGHGMLPVARVALEAGAAWLGVAHVEEALQLRAAGITAPVLAWLHTPETDFAAAIDADIDLGASGWELEQVAEAARAGQHPARVHLKIDTGLGRNGASADAWQSVLDTAAHYQEDGLLRVVGVWTHLAVADEPDRPETDEQLAAFRDAVEQAEAAGFDLELRHAANTPAALSRPDAHFDLVRLGIGMYGLSPFRDQSSEDLGLRPAMRLMARIANAKRMPADHGVSYGLTYRTESTTTLALVPLGYADGVPRVAVEGPVEIAGKRYVSCGRVAMDQFVVDLGDTPVDGLVGEPAVLFGDGGPSADEWAEAAGTINYEIVTRVGPRVGRVYVEGSWGEAGE